MSHNQASQPAVAEIRKDTYSQAEVNTVIDGSVGILQEAGVGMPVAVTVHIIHPSRAVIQACDKKGREYFVKVYRGGACPDVPGKHIRFAPGMATVGMPVPDGIRIGTSDLGRYVYYRGGEDEAGTLHGRLASHPEELGTAFRIIGDLAFRMHTVPGCKGCGNIYQAESDAMTSIWGSAAAAERDDKAAYYDWVSVHLKNVVIQYGLCASLLPEEERNLQMTIDAAFGRLSAPGRADDLVMCHTDLNPKNIIVRNHPMLVVSSIVDFDNISRGPRSVEFSKLLADVIGPRGLEALALFRANFVPAYFPGADEASALIVTTDLLYEALFLRMFERMEAVALLLSREGGAGKSAYAHMLDEINIIQAGADLYNNVRIAQIALHDPGVTAQHRTELLEYIFVCETLAVRKYVERRAIMVQQIAEGIQSTEAYELLEGYEYPKQVVPTSLQEQG